MATSLREALLRVAPGRVTGITESGGGAAGLPAGLLVMMDDQNAGFTSNFRLVPRNAVAASLPE